MKFELDKSELLNAVTIAAKATAQKGVRPILANILIEAENDKIRLVATDMEAMSIIEIPADVTACGKITAPAKLLQELLSSLPGDSLFPVEVSADEKTDELCFSMGKSKFSIRGLDANDFPPVPSVDTEFAAVNGSEFAKGIKQGGIAAAIDEGNPVQKAVFFDFTNMQFASTDSKRLMICKTDDLIVPEEMRKTYIVPTKSANEIAAMFLGAGVAEVAIFKEQLAFRSGRVTYITRLVDGKMPDIQRVIPKESKITATFYKKELGQALKSLAPIAKNNSMIVRLDIGFKEINLSSDGKENGKAETSIACESNGELEIAFNLKYLQDFLGVVDVEKIKLELTTASYPGLMSDGESLRYVIMPLSY
jgi:DNA polymerase-3 subunit beta